MPTEDSLLNEAWERLEASILRYGEEPVGTVAAAADLGVKQYNYGHCFIRDFVPSGLAFLTKGNGKIVANFLRQALKLQINDNNIDAIRTQLDGARPGIGLMPASFEVVEENGEPVIRADLVGDMPMKVCFPAMEGKEWEMVTGCDPKNVRWSYHNGGNWPVLLWFMVAAAQKTGKTNLGDRAIKVAEKRWLEYKDKDKWPEYYDGKKGTLVGKKAMRHQTWTIAAYIVAKDLMENPQHLEWISF